MTEFVETRKYTVTCPDCDSGKVVKCGFQSGHQRYLCRECKNKFRINKVEGRQFDDEQMGAAIRQYYSGLSYKQIAEGMEDRENIDEPSKATPYNWVREYTDVVHDIMKGHKAKSSGDWVADEIVMRCGGQKVYCWNVADRHSKYLYACLISKGRTKREARKVLQMALDAADKPPIRITTDDWDSYKKPIATLMPNTIHNISEGIRAVNNNNISERLQGTIRDREITLRGLDSIETGQRFMNGWTIHYNLFKEHESLKFKPPGEVAFEEPPFKEWADVIRTGKRAPEVNKERTPKSGVSKLRRHYPKALIDKVNAVPAPKQVKPTPPPMELSSRPKGKKPEQMTFPEMADLPTVKMNKPRIDSKKREARARTIKKPRHRRRG